MELDQPFDEHGVVFEECGDFGDIGAIGAEELAVGSAHMFEDEICGVLGGFDVAGFGACFSSLDECGDEQAVPCGQDFVIEPWLFAGLA